MTLAADAQLTSEYGGLAIHTHWDERAILWWASGSGEPLNIQLGRVILWTENACADLAFSNP